MSAEDAPGELSRLGSASSSSPLLSRSPSGLGGAGGPASGSAAAGLGARARRLARAAVVVAKAGAFLLARLLLAVATPLLVLLLRRLVRSRRWVGGAALGRGTGPGRPPAATGGAEGCLSPACLLLAAGNAQLLMHAPPLDRFWERGLASAWHDGRRVTRDYVDAYR